MIKFHKIILVLSLICIPVLVSAFQNRPRQLTALSDSLKNLLVYFQKNTNDQNLIKALEEVQNVYKDQFLNDSLSAKLLKLENLLVGSSLNEQKIFSYRQVITDLFRHHPPMREHPDYAYSLEYLADLYWRRSEFQVALNLYCEALEIKKKALGEQHPEYANILNKLGGRYYVLEQYDKALYLREEELILIEKSEGSLNINYAASLINLIWALHRMGQYDKAIPFCQQTLNILKKTSVKQDSVYAHILSNLARLYHRMGQYEKAQPLYEQTLGIIKKIYGEKHPEYAVSANNLAYFLDKVMGQYDKALPLYEQAMKIIEKAGEQHYGYTNSINNLANLYYTMKQYEKALPLYEKVLGTTMKISGKLQPGYTNSLCNMANLYHKMGHMDKAMSFSSQALDILNNDSLAKHPGYYITLGNLAMLYYDLGEHQTALLLMQKYSTVIEKLSGEEHPLFAASLNNLGMLYAVLGNDTEAAFLLIKATTITLNHLTQTNATLSEQEKLAILKKEAIQFDFLPSLLTIDEISFPDLAKQIYTNELAIKGMVLEDQQNVLRSIRKSGDSISLQLYDQWRINKLYLGNQFLSPIASRVPYLDSLQSATIQLEQELSQRTVAFRNQLQGQRITAPDISHKLLEGQASIEFIRYCFYNKKWTDSILYAAMILMPGDSSVQFIPLFEEKQLLRLIGTSLDSPIDDIVIQQLYGDEREAGKLSHSLYQLIWKPLEKYLDGVRTIYYAPAGLLHRIAFQALRPTPNHFLIDKYRLNQVLSTRSVVFPVETKAKPFSIGIWGNIKYTFNTNMPVRQLTNAENNSDSTASSFNFYNSDTRGLRGGGWEALPSSKQEMDSLTMMFQQAGISFATFEGSFATEEAFKMLDEKSYQVLHLATHGFFLGVAEASPETNVVLHGGEAFKVQQNPMFRSGLVLAGGNHAWKGELAIPGREDGILTAYEIAHLDLSNTELVVLSACKTALGDLQGNEGVIGLQRAFKMAGVKQIIVSLWSVYDEPTMELMTLFYQNWLSGQSTRDALHNAQLKIKEKYTDPYFWAAFVVVE